MTSAEAAVTISSARGAGADAHQLVQAGAWSFTIWGAIGDGEPRIRDLDAGERLGFARPITIRDLIKRMWPGKKRNQVHQIRTVQINGRGRPGVEFWLTEAQLLKLCARSDTELAEAVLDDMIRVYMLVRRGLLTLPKPSESGLTLAGVEALIDQRLEDLGARIVEANLAVLNSLDTRTAALEAWAAELPVELAPFYSALKHLRALERRVEALEIAKQGAASALTATDLRRIHDLFERERHEQEYRRSIRGPDISMPVGRGLEIYELARARGVITWDRQDDIFRYLASKCDADGVAHATIKEIARAAWASPKGNSIRNQLDGFKSKGWLRWERAPSELQDRKVGEGLVLRFFLEVPNAPRADNEAG